MEELSDDPFRVARLLLHLRQEGITDPDVLAAIEATDRSAFVDDPSLRQLALEDSVLPIPCGQVMLRPSVTAHLVQALRLKPGAGTRVLLVGLGSGYMAALLSRLAGDVFAAERFRQLAEAGRARFEKLGIHNIRVSHRDGWAGWPEEGPYDAIVFSAAAPFVPEALTGQLRPQGVLAVPVTDETGQAHLVLLDATSRETGRTPLFQWVPTMIEGCAQVL